MRTADYKVIKNHNISTGHTELYKTGKNSYSLKHYKHEVLRVTNNNIKKVLPVSKSSYSAIIQGLKYLDIPTKNIKDICVKLNKKSIEQMQEEWKPKLVKA